MANISILTMGSRGDVQPMLALALAMKQRGHNVLLAAPGNFRGLVEREGIAFHAITIDIEELARRQVFRQAMAGNVRSLFRLWREQVVPLTEATLQATGEVCRNADLAICHPKILGAPDIAEAFSIPVFWASPIPLVPTGDFPLIALSGNYGRLFNRLTWQVLKLQRWVYLKRWRMKSLGLQGGPLELFRAPGFGAGRQDKVLCAFSPAVVPRPSDWPASVHMTGYWFLQDRTEWRPSAELQRFLEAGPPPIYVGFGSMVSKKQGFLAEMLAGALRQTGLRAVISGGWEHLALENAPLEQVFTISDAPHGKLFPLMSAIVHHGGAGTTAAALASGRPSLVCPFGLDQNFWGARVAGLGCGPKPLPVKQMTAARLADRLLDLTTAGRYEAATRNVAARICTEDGLAHACQLIERELGSAR